MDLIATKEYNCARISLDDLTLIKDFLIPELFSTLPIAINFRIHSPNIVSHHNLPLFSRVHKELTLGFLSTVKGAQTGDSILIYFDTVKLFQSYNLFLSIQKFNLSYDDSKDSCINM